MTFQSWDVHFQKHRTALVAFAFRMTGSLAEAEDLVQDAFIECAKVSPDEIENHKAWLTKVVSNKALDHLKSAYKQREQYKGPWLPDAIPESLQAWQEESPSQEKRLLLSESLTTSFLLLMERLNPEERAVYLMSEVFDYSFKEISEFLQKPEPTCRKIAQRAREFIVANRKRFESSPVDSSRLIVQFFESAKAGDHAALMKLLAHDSEFWSDGGGKVAAATKVLDFPEAIAKFWVGLGQAPFMKSIEYKLELHQVNGRPGAVISRKLPSGEWVFDTLICFEFEQGKIARLYAQRNPDKLVRLTESVS